LYCCIYIGYAKLTHEGGFHGFESKLTLLPDVDMAVFTNTNGPATNGTYLNRVLHAITLDALFNVSAWLSNDTACTYPLPWLPKKVPSSSPSVSNYTDAVNDTILKVKVQSNVDNNDTVLLTEIVPDEHNNSDSFGSNMENSSYTQYEGIYGHCLFGNITISYNTNNKRLVFKFGQIGTGHLGNHNSTTWYLNLTHDIKFYKNSVSNFEFFDLETSDDFSDGRYANIRASAFEIHVPPVFARNLCWDDDACTKTSGRSKSDLKALSFNIMGHMMGAKSSSVEDVQSSSFPHAQSSVIPVFCLFYSLILISLFGF